jgi:D-alanyl-D-alanine carboxypeptidase
MTHPHHAPAAPRRRRAVPVTLAAIAVAASLATASAPALAGAATTAASTAAAPRAGNPLQGMLSQIVADGVPGAIALEQHGHGTDLAAAGVADLAAGAPLRPGAEFRIGSITKSFVATVVLQLVQEGRLALGQPVGRWLPGLLTDGDTITIRELLNHTSGLYDYTNDPGLIAGVEANRVFQPAALVAIAESHPRLFPPGTAWAYADTNYIVLGLLIQAVTGRSLSQELQHRILRPLGLGHTSLPVTTAHLPGYHAHGYVILTPGGQPYDVTGYNTSSYWASGGIISTASDLSRFYQALLGGDLLTPRMLGQMKTTVEETPGDPTQQYGLGIERYEDPCGITWGLGGLVPGYEDSAFWNQGSHRMVVLATTLWPGESPAVDTLAGNIIGDGLCPGLTPRR